MSNIKKLKNPKSDHYRRFKGAILEEDFPWYYNASNSTTPSFFSHKFITRPEEGGWEKFPVKSSDNVEHAHWLVTQILDHNDIEVKCLLRMNLNLVYPYHGRQETPVHVDHEYPHKNLIIYFTSAGGKIIMPDIKESFDPREDDVIMFESTPHYIELPRKEFRIALVTTYI